MEAVKNKIKPQGHFIDNRHAEMAIGFALFFLGALLIWDSFDGRNKKLPWLLGAVLPW